MTGRVYVHSASSDFADTDRLPPHEYLGRAQACPAREGGRCGCEAPAFVRVRRAGWMRLVPSLRVYRCASCGERVLRLRATQRSGYGPVYLPARPVNPELQRLLALVARLPLGADPGPRR